MKEHHRRVKRWLEHLGATCIAITHRGNRHPRLSFIHGGRNYQVPIAGSTGDVRAHLNMIADLKRRTRGAP